MFCCCVPLWMPVDWAWFNVEIHKQCRLSGRQFYRSKNPTNSIKVLKEKTLQKYGKPRKSKQHKIQQYNKVIHIQNTASPLVYTSTMAWLGDGSHRGQGHHALTAVGLPQRYPSRCQSPRVITSQHFYTQGPETTDCHTVREVTLWRHFWITVYMALLTVVVGSVWRSSLSMSSVIFSSSLSSSSSEYQFLSAAATEPNHHTTWTHHCTTTSHQHHILEAITVTHENTEASLWL